MKKLGKTLIQVQYGASIVAALMLLVMIGYEVFARYVLKSSLMGIEELMFFLLYGFTCWAAPMLPMRKAILSVES